METSLSSLNPKLRHKVTSANVATEQSKAIAPIDEKPTLPCPHCPRLFSRRNMVTRHINEIHKIPLSHSCDLCDKTFSVIPSLQKHLMNFHKVDPEPYKCPHCSETFTLQKLLDCHNCHKSIRVVPLKRLTKEARPVYYCKVCNKEFRAKSTLKKHLQNHYKCSNCRRAYATKGGLRRHIRSHEFGVDEESKKYSCETCNRKYLMAENLEVHKVWHAESWKVFSCDKCDLRFGREEQWRRHRNSCEASSSEDDEVVKEIKEETFTCQLCSREFLRKIGFERHQLKCSGKAEESEEEMEEVPAPETMETEEVVMETNDVVENSETIATDEKK